MSSLILPYPNSGEKMAVSLDFGQIPHDKTGDTAYFIDRSQCGASISIGLDVQLPSDIVDAFPKAERKNPPVEVVATITSIDGSVRSKLPIKKIKPNLYHGSVNLDLARITESARIAVYAIRASDSNADQFAQRKGARVAWAPAIELRLVERPKKGNFLNVVWEDFGASQHVPAHFASAMHYLDAAVEEPILYLNSAVKAPLYKLLDTQGHGHPKALPRDVLYKGIAADAWMTLAQNALAELHEEAQTAVP